MIPIPDLLFPKARLAFDGPALTDLLEISFLGGDSSGHLDAALSRPLLEASSWDPEFFHDDLFLDALVKETFTVEVEGRELPINRPFLRGVLSRPPSDLETVRFRQAILQELSTDPELRRRALALYGELFRLLSLFKAPHKRANLDITLFRLEILEQARAIVERMAADFAEAGSGLSRLAETAERIRQTREFKLLIDLLDYENHLAKMSFRVRIGADGRIKNLVIEGVRENVRNPFYRGPWQRLKARFELSRRGFDFGRKELVNRLVHQVFLEISDWLRPLVQVSCHLAFYLGALSFKRRAEAAGLQVTLPEVGGDRELELEELFNPLLFRLGRPIPADLEAGRDRSLLIVTGPNSGGKTRMIQAVGIAQVFGQSGLFVPAARARMPLVDGLFVSTTETASVDQTEGRLGTELLRIRKLFRSIGPGSLVMIDELCSGTNPSEAEEIFLMVLQLLERLEPVAIITTHFLDFARAIAEEPPVTGLQFLQVEMDADQRSTYQFVPGVAPTSLASTTAERLGVTFDELARRMEAAEPEEAVAGACAGSVAEGAARREAAPDGSMAVEEVEAAASRVVPIRRV